MRRHMALTGNVWSFTGRVSIPPLLVYYSAHYYHHHIDNVESDESWEEDGEEDEILTLKTNIHYKIFKVHIFFTD